MNDNGIDFLYNIFALGGYMMKRALSIVLILVMICSMILSSCCSEREPVLGAVGDIHTDATIDFGGETIKEDDLVVNTDTSAVTEVKIETDKPESDLSVDTGNNDSSVGETEMESVNDSKIDMDKSETDVFVDNDKNDFLVDDIEKESVNDSKIETEKSEIDVPAVDNKIESSTDNAEDKSSSDISKLIEEITIAEGYVEGKNENNYVSDSWQIYQNALAEAIVVRDNNNASAADVENAYNALQTAVEELKYKALTVNFGTYNVAGSTATDATAIANEILKDTGGNLRNIDVIGFQGLENEAQLLAIYNELSDDGYISYKYFNGANGNIGFISKFAVKNPGKYNPKVMTGSNGFKYGYVQLLAKAEDGSETLINFYVCGFSDDEVTRAKQISDLGTELDKLNSAKNKYSKSNYFIAGYFGTSDYSEFGAIKNNLGIVNKIYSTASGDKGPWGTTIADANSSTNKNTEYPDGFLYHDDAWELTVLGNGAFRRGTTNQSKDINKNHGLTHLLCYAEATFITSRATAQLPTDTENNGASADSNINNGSEETNVTAESETIETTAPVLENISKSNPKVIFATYNVAGSTESAATAIANEILKDTSGVLRNIDVIGLQGLESEAHLVAIYNALSNAGYVSYKYFSGANGGIGFISKLPINNPGRYNPKIITGSNGFKYGYVQLVAKAEDGTEQLINFYVCRFSDDAAVRVNQIADLKAEIDKTNTGGTKYSKSNYFIAGNFGTSDYNEFAVIKNNLGIANKVYATANGDKGPWGTTIADANSTTDKNTVYPDGFLYHDAVWEITVLKNGAFRRGTTNKTKDINKNYGLTNLLCYVEATFFASGIKTSDTPSINDTNVEVESGVTEQETVPHEHSFGEWKTTKSSTCVNNGEQTRTCECGAKETKTVAALGHVKVKDAAKAATCTATGLTEGQHCSRCNKVLTAQKEVAALGHIKVADPAKAATCTATGLTAGQHCSRCNKVLTAQKEVAALGHIKVVDPAKDATCTAAGLTAGQHCSRCNKVLNAQKEVAALGHSKVNDAAKAATCTADGLTAGQHCSRCNKVLVKQEVVKAKGHTTNGSTKEPTCTEYGWTSGGTCSTCGIKLEEKEYIKPTGHTIVDHKCVSCSYERIDFSDVDIYSSKYAYNYLGDMTNGSKMQTLYSRIEDVIKDFHVNNKTATKLIVNCSDLGFKTTDSYAQLAFSRFLYDNPLYYWLSGGYSYSYNPSSKVITSISITVVPEYSDGSVRSKLNAEIYAGAEEYYSVVENEESEYNITLAYYDMIISDINYVYESDGVTAQDDKWAHSVVGVFTKQGAVCEGYAKALQLMLNVSGVENIYVTGDSNGPHAWSMIKLDDGKWYWFDATWDDSGTHYEDWMAGKDNFAAIDSSVDMAGKNFAKSHVPDIDNKWGWPSLPERSTTEFDDADVVEVMDTFVVGANTYQVVGYYKVHLVASTVKSGSYKTEDMVVYDGKLYEVVGTGTMSSTGQIVFDSVFSNQSVSEIIFSDNIERIQGFQNCKTVTSVTISKNTDYIVMYAFAYCTRLKTINFEGTTAEWNAINKGSGWKTGYGTITINCTNGTLTA